MPMKTMKAMKAMKTMKTMQAMIAIKKAMKALKAQKTIIVKMIGWRFMRAAHQKVVFSKKWKKMMEMEEEMKAKMMEMEQEMKAMHQLLREVAAEDNARYARNWARASASGHGSVRF